MSDWPTQTEIAQACRNLWTGNQIQHVAIVTRALAEVRNIRNQEGNRG